MGDIYGQAETIRARRNTSQVVIQQARFSERLRQARKAAALTQRELASRLAVHPLSVGRWERGQQTPDGATISRLAQLLGVTADYLLGLDVDQRPAEDINVLSSEEISLIQAYRRLDQRGRYGIRRMIRWELHELRSDEE